MSVRFPGGRCGGKRCVRGQALKGWEGPRPRGTERAEKLELCSIDGGRPWMVLELGAAHRHPLERSGSFHIFLCFCVWTVLQGGRRLSRKPASESSRS